jgi:murein hydrolase activator
MRWPLLLILLAAVPVLAADEVAPSPEAELTVARADVARASAEEQKLTAAAASAGNEAQKFAAERRAAAAAIAAAEARIAVAQAELTIARTALATQRQNLAERQAPVAGLLAGLVEMGRRPPLLALAGGSSEEFVRVRALLDTTMPVIRARTAALAGELATANRAEQAAATARDALAGQRAALDQQRARFAELEHRALSRQATLSGQAFGAGDATLVGGEALASLDDEAARRRVGQAAARALALLDPLPPRPSAPDGKASLPPFAYQLPIEAPVAAGLGSVDANGVRSRGLTLRTGRGATILVPADGRVVFAGPYRRADGVVIIDHGGGWMSLLVNVATDLPKGSTVHMGDPLGRTLGPLEVELSKRGTNVSPAFIAASSAMLSNRAKGS